MKNRVHPKVGSKAADMMMVVTLRLRFRFECVPKQMVDANQAWSVNEAIEWMKKLAPLKPMWIEEPTSPDDVLGHATISKALE